MKIHLTTFEMIVAAMRKAADKGNRKAIRWLRDAGVVWVKSHRKKSTNRLTKSRKK